MNTETQKKVMLEQIRLSYYNNYLYEKGVITENERNRMKNMIASNCHVSVKNKKSRGLDR